MAGSSPRDRSAGALALLAALALFVVACAQNPTPQPSASATPAESGSVEAASAPAPSAPDPDPWPKVIDAEKYRVEIYPPQVESWDGLELSGVCAVVAEKKAKGDEGARKEYGSIAFSARTLVDKEERLVTIDQLQVAKVAFPSSPDREEKLAAFVQKRYGSAVRTVSLDALEASAAAASARVKAVSQPVKNDPPAIRMLDRPALLVNVDGAPVWRAVEGTSYERLLNTRPLVLRAQGGAHYLRLFDGWMSAAALEGPWTVAPGASGLDQVAKAATATQPADYLDGGGDEKTEVDADGNPIAKPTLAKGPVPEIVVATEPTELLITDGAAKWMAIAGTGLEYVENTTGNLFRLGGTHYVLLSGRWFQAATLEGPWTFVPQASLAADFAKIPDDSPKENVKSSVAGTPQAAEAVIANSVPETSEITIATAKFSPLFDGAPKFEAIEGTSLRYAVNTPSPVIRVGEDRFFGLQDGVWFVAAKSEGPWSVARRVDAAIYSIPTSSPLHYVTYVKVFASTADEVTVGYTPGYYGTTVADEVVVYGTGYAYQPWIGSSWYGYPPTWGYGYGGCYAPWSGWSFCAGVGWAWGYWGGWYAPYYGPYWGPYYGYGWYGGALVTSRGGAAVWGPGGWAGTTGNIYRNWGKQTSSVSRRSGGYNAWTGNAWRGQVGAAYNSRTGSIAAGQRGAVGNVYTGEYAYGGRGVARSGKTGNVVGGSRVTMGDADTGRQITAGRVGGYNPGTGEGGSAGWVRGDQGGVARVGDDYYATRDGEVYKRNGQGDWSQVDRGGDWKPADSARTRDLSRQSSSRSMGQQRYQSNRSMSPGFGRGGGGMRMGGGGRRR